MAVTDYMILTGGSPDNLTAQVAAAVGNGWTPAGISAFHMGERICREMLKGSDQGITTFTDYTLVSALSPAELQAEVVAAIGAGYQPAATAPFQIGERVCRELIKGSGGSSGGGPLNHANAVTLVTAYLAAVTAAGGASINATSVGSVFTTPDLIVAQLFIDITSGGANCRVIIPMSASGVGTVPAMSTGSVCVSTKDASTGFPVAHHIFVSPSDASKWEIDAGQVSPLDEILYTLFVTFCKTTP